MKKVRLNPITITTTDLSLPLEALYFDQFSLVWELVDPIKPFRHFALSPLSLFYKIRIIVAAETHVFQRHYEKFERHPQQNLAPIKTAEIRQTKTNLRDYILP